MSLYHVTPRSVPQCHCIMSHLCMYHNVIVSCDTYVCTTISLYHVTPMYVPQYHCILSHAGLSLYHLTPWYALYCRLSPVPILSRGLSLSPKSAPMRGKKKGARRSLRSPDGREISGAPRSAGGKSCVRFPALTRAVTRDGVR